MMSNVNYPEVLGNTVLPQIDDWPKGLPVTSWEVCTLSCFQSIPTVMRRTLQMGPNEPRDTCVFTTSELENFPK